MSHSTASYVSLASSKPEVSAGARSGRACAQVAQVVEQKLEALLAAVTQ